MSQKYKKKWIVIAFLILEKGKVLFSFSSSNSGRGKDRPLSSSSLEFQLQPPLSVLVLALEENLCFVLL